MMRTAPHEEGAVTSLVEPAGAPDLASQRERSLELDPDLRPRLGAPAGVQNHAQDAVDAEPGVPEAGVGVAFAIHLVVGHGAGAPHSQPPVARGPSARATERSRSRRL